jgi:anti-sigma-K factor RskA
MRTRRFNKLLKRLSAGELTADGRRELDELCLGDNALRAEVRQIETILAAAHGAKPELPSPFVQAAFSTRLRATIEAERPQPYGRLRLRLAGLALMPAFAPRRLAVAVSVVAAAAIALVVALTVLGPGTPAPVQNAAQSKEEGTLVFPEPGWTSEEIEAVYPVARLLPDEEVVTLERQLQSDFDAVHQAIEATPLDENGVDDEGYIVG